MTAPEGLLTAEEYLLLPDMGWPTELVRGRVIRLSVSTPRHGQVCAELAYLLQRYLDEYDIGHVINLSGIITQRDPDTVRGADVAFYSYNRVPRGPLPQGYLPVPPELVFEIRSPTDRWRNVLAKVTEYLDAGVDVVCVLDPSTQAAHLFDSNHAPREFPADAELTIPDVLPHFRVPVSRFFE